MNMIAHQSPTTAAYEAMIVGVLELEEASSSSEIGSLMGISMGTSLSFSYPDIPTTLLSVLEAGVGTAASIGIETGGDVGGRARSETLTRDSNMGSTPSKSLWIFATKASRSWESLKGKPASVAAIKFSVPGKWSNWTNSS